jgi:hypothetical protein
MNASTAPMHDLAEVSRKLNKQSDTLNQVISSINTKLESMNIGLEVWFEDVPVDSGDPYSTYGNADRDHEYPFPARDVTLLGYTCINEKWVLAVKSAVLVTEQGRTGEAYETITESSELRPLLNASRQIRAKSMRIVPRLLAEIRNQAQEALDSIEAAKKAAELL